MEEKGQAVRVEIHGGLAVIVATLKNIFLYQPHCVLALKLFDNDLEELPTLVCDLINLEEVRLGYNRLTTLPVEFAKLTRLKDLHLYYNQLSELPRVVCELINLESLWLGGNRLRTLPAELTKLNRLRKLELQNNQLSHVPQVVWELSHLREVSLAQNKLKSLPEEVSKLTHLEVLWLHDNQLVSLPPTMVRLETLHGLSLSESCFHAFPLFIGLLPQLVYLKVGGELCLEFVGIRCVNIDLLRYLQAILWRTFRRLLSTLNRSRALLSCLSISSAPVR